ncbi:MAG: low molecular weight protein-tyrosine-phosphatase [Bradymonadaceae bacterium]
MMNSSPIISVMFFCLGNICRSPLAEALFRFEVQSRSLEARFLIESSGTSAYHIGEPPDAGSVRVARRRLSLDISDQRAQQLSREHIERFDYLVAMDRSNQGNAQHLAGSLEQEILLLRDFEPDPALHGEDVPDPWGGGPSHFDEVYDIVARSTRELLEYIIESEGL